MELLEFISLHRKSFIITIRGMELASGGIELPSGGMELKSSMNEIKLKGIKI